MARSVALALLALAVICAVAIAGTPVTGEIPVNTTTTAVQGDPAIAMDADGDFAVAWVDTSGGSAAVVLRRFNSAGAPTSGEIDVGGNDPSVALNSAGDKGVVAYRDGDDIFARLFDTGGPSVRSSP